MGLLYKNMFNNAAPNNRDNSGRFSGLFFLGLFMAVGLSIGGFFISKTICDSKVALNTAVVKGLAERRVLADKANWYIEFNIYGKESNEIPTLSKKAENIQNNIVALLRNYGF